MRGNENNELKEKYGGVCYLQRQCGLVVVLSGVHIKKSLNTFGNTSGSEKEWNVFFTVHIFVVW